MSQSLFSPGFEEDSIPGLEGVQYHLSWVGGPTGSKFMNRSSYSAQFFNLPNSGSCGCPPGTEPPVPASEVQALRVRLEILEELVKGLKEQCTGGCCPAAAQAGTGERMIPGRGTEKEEGGEVG